MEYLILLFVVLIVVTLPISVPAAFYIRKVINSDFTNKRPRLSFWGIVLVMNAFFVFVLGQIWTDGWNNFGK